MPMTSASHWALRGCGRKEAGPSGASSAWWPSRWTSLFVSLQHPRRGRLVQEDRPVQGAEALPILSTSQPQFPYFMGCGMPGNSERTEGPWTAGQPPRGGLCPPGESKRRGAQVEGAEMK